MKERDVTPSGLIGGSLLGLALFAFGAGPAPAQAQQADGSWMPWLGCWEPAREGVSSDLPDALVCFRPVASNAGIEMLSVEGGEIVARQTIHADGQRHDVEAEGCSGWELGEFASRPGRVFFRSEQSCEGGTERSATGLMAMVSSDGWLDVRVSDDGGEKLTWVAKYELASQSATDEAGLGDIAAGRVQAVYSARAAAAARPTVEDVIEATEHVDGEAVSAWVAERGIPLAVDSEALVQLADAGVPEDVIDMVIAVSYPERFAVDRGAERADPGYGEAYGPRVGIGARWGYYDPFYGSLFYSPFGFYSPYAYGFGYRGYGYGGYGYGGFGYGGFGYGGRYVPVVIDRNNDSGGRVISGQGYRRGPASGATRGRSSQPRSGAVPRSSGSTRGSVGSSSRGSSGRSTGRTARRRGGGGS